MRWQRDYGDFGLKLVKRKKPIACVSCSKIGDDIQIKYLFTLKKYRNFGIEQYMLKQVIKFGEQNNAKQIIAYLGAEPFSEDEQMALGREKALYESEGFVLSHMVCGVVPCMKKQLREGEALCRT